MTGVGSSPALATCKTSQVLLADVLGGFPGVLPFRPIYGLPLLDNYERNNLERDVKLNQKKKKAAVQGHYMRQTPAHHSLFK